MGIPIGTKPGGKVYHPPIAPPPPPPRRTELIGGHGSGPSASSPGTSASAPQAQEPGGMLASNPANVYQPGQVAPLGYAFDQFLRQRQSPLAGLGNVFVRQARKQGIDPRLLLAITGAETSFGTYGPSQAIHNPFGMGPGINYPSWRDSIRAAATNLGENYFGQGLDTIPEIQGKWAPSGAANDPTDLNSNWTRNVTKFYNELKNVRPRYQDLPVKAGLSELIYDPAGYWFRGQGGVTQAAYGGHGSHLHAAATNPRVMLAIARRANRLGLTLDENPLFGGVDPVHAGTSSRYGDSTGTGGPSNHYVSFPGRFNNPLTPGFDPGELGQGVDITGARLGDLFNWIAQRYVGGADYNYGSRGDSGYSVTGPATPSQATDYANAAQMVANTSGPIMGAATSASGDTPGRRRRKKKTDETIEALITALAQSSAGAQAMTRKGKARGNTYRS